MYLINRDNSNSVSNPAYCTNIETTNKDFMTVPDCDEHIYDSISFHDDKDGEVKVQPKSMASSTAYQHRLQNPYDDDRVSIKSDDVSCDESGGYSTPYVKGDGAHSSKPKPSPKPRCADVISTTDAKSINRNLPTNDEEYVLHDARQKVDNDEYVLHDATQRVDKDEYVSLDTTHTFESEEYITHGVSNTVEGNGYASVDITQRKTENDYQEAVHQPPPPPGYSVPSNIPATN